MTIKIGWGTKIALLYFGFMALIVALVTGSLRQDLHLVSKDYYGEELKYQNVINASQNQAGLSAAVSVQQEGRQIQLVFPGEFSDMSLKGTAHFYSQVNAAWDRTYDLDIIKGHSQLPVADLQPTSYLVKLQWRAGDKDYYQETPITIR